MKSKYFIGQRSRRVHRSASPVVKFHHYSLRSSCKGREDHVCLQNVEMEQDDEHFSKEEVKQIHQQHQNEVTIYKKALKEVISKNEEVS